MMPEPNCASPPPSSGKSPGCAWRNGWTSDESNMSAITTHVLDTSRGLPAAGIRVTLEVQFPDGAWKPSGRAVTDADGRARKLLPEAHALTEGVYRLTFDNLPGDRALP